MTSDLSGCHLEVVLDLRELVARVDLVAAYVHDDRVRVLIWWGTEQEFLGAGKIACERFKSVSAPPPTSRK